MIHDVTILCFVIVAMLLAGIFYWVRTMSVKEFRVGFIYDRCFSQKEFEFASGAVVSPLRQTGFSGRISDAVNQLRDVGFSFSDQDLQNTLKNFANTGHCVLVSFESVPATDFVAAIETKESEAENVVGALSVVSANPAMPLCSFAEAADNPGVKFYIPPDRIIRHGTNIPGYLDALPDIEERSRTDSKFSLLLRLFRATLRETEVDNQILFQLVLFEEASDGEEGHFADRLRRFSETTGFAGDLAILAGECGVKLPEGKDVIDLIVKLRNAATHNGNISEESLREYNGEWVISILKDKPKLHKLITEALRYMFCCMVGHTREAKAISISGNVEVRFD